MHKLEWAEQERHRLQRYAKALKLIKAIADEKTSSLEGVAMCRIRSLVYEATKGEKDKPTGCICPPTCITCHCAPCQCDRIYDEYTEREEE